MANSAQCSCSCDLNILCTYYFDPVSQHSPPPKLARRAANPHFHPTRRANPSAHQCNTHVCFSPPPFHHRPHPRPRMRHDALPRISPSDDPPRRPQHLRQRKAPVPDPGHTDHVSYPVAPARLEGRQHHPPHTPVPPPCRYQKSLKPPSPCPGRMSAYARLAALRPPTPAHSTHSHRF